MQYIVTSETCMSLLDAECMYCQLSSPAARTNSSMTYSKAELTSEAHNSIMKFSDITGL